MDICITIPKTIKWSDYEKELDKVRFGKESMFYRVPFRPKTDAGNKCYICHDGYIKGYMMIRRTMYIDGFTCTTTGKYWPE